ncbi:Probable protein phosphatase 2C 55, partial [Striga hermonthica]
MPTNYFSRFRGAIWRGVWTSLSAQETGSQSQVDILIGQGKLFLGQSRLSHSLASGTFTDLHALVWPGTFAVAQENLYLTNQKKNLSVVEAFSRVLSIPSVSGPSFQACKYHIDRLISDPFQILQIKDQKAPMAVCGSTPAFFDCAISNLKPTVGACRPFGSCNRIGFVNCRKFIMGLRNNEQPNKFLLYGYFIYTNLIKGKGNGDPLLGFGFDGFHVSSPAYSSACIAPDASCESVVKENHHSSSADSSEPKTPKDRTLKLNSGSCYLPHPDKEDTGGEDAHFICADEQAIGVADGVGGWADVGVDAGKYARELMSNSVCAVQEEPRGSVDPARVLEKAYTRTQAKGSSTACIIALTEQGLHAVNLGDSGFMVVRDGCTVFRSPAQQHDFNFTYQLECGNAGDLPSSGQVFTIPVAPGDIIIAGTDGLFDNLYNNDITAVVVQASRAGLGPQVTAQKIAALARQRAQDKNRQTPFSTAAQEAGFRYYGGKLDDITVVVSYIAADYN